MGIIIDLVLVMGVFPGEGGQGLIEETTSKLQELVSIRNEKKLDFLINFDGGVNDKTRHLLDDADILVSGSYICLGDNFQERINNLREDLEINFL